MSGDPHDDAPRTSQGRWVPPPFVPAALTPEESALIHRRQRTRAVAMAIALGLLVVLFYAIGIAKMARG